MGKEISEYSKQLEAEKSARIMLDAIPLCINLWDKALNMIDCNQEAITLFGLTCKRDYLQKFSALSPEFQPDGRPSMAVIYENVSEAFDKGRLIFEWMHQKLNCEQIPCEVTLIHIVNDNQNIVVGYTKDLRNILEARALMYDADERAQIMLDLTPLCANFWDKNYNNIDCNQEAVNLFNLMNKQEYLNRFHDLSPEYQPDGKRSHESALKKIKEAFKTGYVCFEWMHQKLNGEEIPSEITLIRVKLRGEYNVVGYTRDLRKLKEYIYQLREADERTQIMLDATPLCCNFWDENYNNIDCNQEAVNLFDLANKQEYLDRFFELSPQYQPDGRLSTEKAQEKIKLAFDTSRVRFEWMHQKLNGELIPAEITLVRVKRGDKYIVTGYTRDLRELKQTIESLDHLEKLAFTDSLTGAYNRRYFMGKADEELVNTKFTDKPFSIIMIDIDKFKHINDTYGHTIGDEVLKLVVSSTQSVLRRNDTLARYGGEEFLVMVTKANMDMAVKLARRIRKKVAATAYQHENKAIDVTISLGVGTKLNNEMQLIDIIEAADKALYRAKMSGRNKVEY